MVKVFNQWKTNFIYRLCWERIIAIRSLAPSTLSPNGSVLLKVDFAYLLHRKKVSKPIKVKKQIISKYF